MSAEWVMAWCAVLTLVGGLAWLYTMLVYRLGRQDAELKWQSATLARMARKGGSVPPPREKLMTLDEPLERLDP